MQIVLGKIACNKELLFARREYEQATGNATTKKNCLWKQGGSNYPYQGRCASCRITTSANILDVSVHMYACVVEEIIQWWYAI